MSKNEGGKKFDGNKPDSTLIPVEFIIQVSKVLGFGAGKYGKHNFRDGLNYTRLLSSIKRHIDLEIAGVETDKDSGMPHWALAGSAIAMYAFMKTHRPELDDRYKYTDEEKNVLEEMMYSDSDEKKEDITVAESTEESDNYGQYLHNEELRKSYNESMKELLEETIDSNDNELGL